MATQGKTSPALRDEAVRSLQQYVSETLEYIDTVRNFSGGHASGWRLAMNAELDTLKRILEELEEKKKMTKDEQQKTLSTALKNTLEGVEKLTCFLDAVEKLAVTSLPVFTGGEEVVKLSLGFSLESVEDIILAAQLVCPLLLCFRRDAEVFFTPSLHNLAVFEAVLDKYIRITKIICDVFCSAIDFEDERGEPPQVQLAEDLTSDVVQNISSHVDQLSDIREDQDFRLLFLFQGESVSGFVDQFSECLPRMLQFLDEMEGCAVQLDRMRMGSKISSVAGSSVGVVGGVLGLVGLVLAPGTAGASLGLIYWGLGMGISSGVNYGVTTATEIAVNSVQNKSAEKSLLSFMKDVESIQACLDKVINQRESELGVDNWDKIKAGKGVLKVVKFGSGVAKIRKVFSKGTMSSMGMKFNKGLVATGKMVVGIGLNVLFIGLDIYTICTDSISLYRGEQSEASEFIRARAALLRSEVDCWTRIHDSVGTGMKQFESRENVLQSSFRNQL
ncbi:apolipoprotein L2-like [Gadus chalcogrammus]|uniref:apolipoprotein L2-like n=1 Tax=Gadus chalcogrammus TaxID=1042646 RepID=UPI0024C2382F|nr:apolipoprotein L2-like [Gadus chalcogrammus]